MKTNFTTPEQSKRLLELGVPADSADCFYDTMRDNPFEGIPQVRSDKFGNSTSFFEDLCFWAGSPIEKVVPSHRIPCWSVGRLLEIYLRCADRECFSHNEITFDYDEPILAQVYELFVVAAGLNELDFSKLEE